MVVINCIVIIENDNKLFYVQWHKEEILLAYWMHCFKLWNVKCFCFQMYFSINYLMLFRFISLIASLECCKETNFICFIFCCVLNLIWLPKIRNFTIKGFSFSEFEILRNFPFYIVVNWIELMPLVLITLLVF
jgi:hypothetical protein